MAHHKQIGRLAALRWKTRRQCRHVALHRPTQPHQRHERQIVFAAFNSANVTAIQPCLMGKPFL